MDGTIPIENNRLALKRVIVAIAAMAGLGGAATAVKRSLYLVILRLLRPAELAVRRLIIASARGIVVTLPPLQKSKKLKPGTIKPSDNPRFSLFDPQAPFSVRLPFRPQRDRRRKTPKTLPRVWALGMPVPVSIPKPKPVSPDDLIDLTKLTRRLTALDRALDDLPGQARRFARWQKRQQAGRVTPGSPLRLGPPRGCRLTRFDPGARRRRNVREIDEILIHCHALARYALDYPDTS
ncbi:MAG: hypothetical protein LCH61_05885 [Proteobacteria bacterium]|nr:hypothetical protein [Pseudomonadota bacterium]